MNHLILLAVLLPPPGEGRQPDAPSPRAIRFARAACERRLAPVSVKLVENGGDVALAALQSCGPVTARRLCLFYNDGGADKLDFNALLACIAHPGNGEEVAAWALAHSEELQDPAVLQAYTSDPLPVAMRLKPLDAQVAAYRDRQRPSQLAAESPSQQWRMPEIPSWFPPAGVLVVAAIVIAVKRRRARLAAHGQ